MKNNQIANILNISKYTVSKIINGKTHFRKHLIQQVEYYRNAEIGVEQFIKEKEMKVTADTVIKRLKKKDTEHYFEVISTATQILHWNKNLNSPKFNLNDIIKLSSDPLELFTSDIFLILLSFGLQYVKSSDLRMKICDYETVAKKLRRAFK